MPFWRGDRAGPARRASARASARSRASCARAAPTRPPRGSAHEHGLDARAADNLLATSTTSTRAVGAVPDDRTIVIERVRRRARRLARLRALAVRQPRARAVGDGRRRAGSATRARARCRRRSGPTTASSCACRTATSRPTRRAAPARSRRGRGRWSCASSAARRCSRRASARPPARALLLPRRRPGQRTPLWAQRKRAATCWPCAARYPSFPIVLETYRECLRDVFDLPALVELAARASSRARSASRPSTRARPRRSRPRCSSVTSPTTSTTATRRWPSAARRRSPSTRRSSASSSARPSSASSSIADVVREHERQLQRLDAPLRHADAVHDLLLRLGDLGDDEIAAGPIPRSSKAASPPPLRPR